MDRTGQVQIMHLLSSFEVGGAEAVALNLAGRIDRERFHVCACSLNGDGPMAERFSAAGIPAHTVTGGRLRKLLRLRRLLRAVGVDVLHGHNSQALIHGSLAGRLAGTPVVLATRHAISLPTEDDSSWFWERRLSRRLAHQVAVSEMVLERGLATERMCMANSSVIVNGIDTAVYRPRERGASSGSVTVGCVARLSHEKCHSVLLQALARLQGGANVRLKLVGDGSLREQLEREAVGLGLAERVEFLGSRSDVPDLLRELDIFVLASRFEGLPLTVMEAMATALPVVATRVGGLAELVEDGANGLLVAPEDPAALAEALGRLAGDAGLRARMGAEGRRLAVGRFDLGVAARKHEVLYERLLTEARGK